MTLLHHVLLYSSLDNSNEFQLMDIIEQIIMAEYEIEWDKTDCETIDSKYIDFSTGSDPNRRKQLVKDCHKFQTFDLECHNKINHEQYIIFNIDTNYHQSNNRFSPFRWYHFSIPSLAWVPNTDEERKIKCEIFNSVFSLVQKISEIIKPFYGYCYLGEYNEEYENKYILTGKAKRIFDLTFWGPNYINKTNPTYLIELQKVGFNILQKEYGIWIYFSPDYWYTPEFWNAIQKADDILHIEKQELDVQ